MMITESERLLKRERERKKRRKGTNCYDRFQRKY